MLNAFYRGITDRLLAAPPPPPLIERESRGQLAGIDAQVGVYGMGARPPESLSEFVEAYSDAVTVFRCAGVNAGAVAGLKLRFYRDLGGDEREELPRDHPLVMTFRRPNPRMSMRRWVFASQLFKELTGDCYSEVVVKPAHQLWPLNSALMEPATSKRRGVIGYKYHVAQPPEEFSTDEVWQDSFYNPSDEIRGLSPVMPARDNIAAEQQLDQGMRAILQNGMRLSGVLHVDKEASQTQVSGTLAQLTELYSSVRNWGKLLVVAGGRKFEALTMTPENIQADSLREWNTGATMRAFGLWPVVFGIVDRSSTRENATTQLLLYQMLTVLPRAGSLAEEITERLIPMLGIPDTDDVIAEFDMSSSPIMRTLQIEEARANAILVEKGILTPNEVRAPAGFEPVAWGDMFWGNSNTVPLANLDGITGPAMSAARTLRTAAGLPADPMVDELTARLSRTTDPAQRFAVLLREVSRTSAQIGALTAGAETANDE